MTRFKLSATFAAAIALLSSAGVASAAGQGPIASGLKTTLAPVTSIVTPKLIGSTIQVGTGDLRVGSPTGLIGSYGTPTTKVGVSALAPKNQPQGSLATVGILNGTAEPLTIRVTGH